MIFIKPPRHMAGAIVDRLQNDFGSSLDTYLARYNSSKETREVLKELAAIFFRLPPGDQVFKTSSNLPESELLPLIMTILICPYFWDKVLAEQARKLILKRSGKLVAIQKITADASKKYPDICWDTHADLLRFLIVRLPPYQTSKLPTRITSEELPDFLDTVGAGPLLQRYTLDELLLAFTLLGYPVYANPSGEGWNVGFQVLGARTLAGALGRNAMVGRAKVDALNNFNSTEV